MNKQFSVHAVKQKQEHACTYQTLHDGLWWIISRLPTVQNVRLEGLGDVVVPNQ
jgi:hypothetical protein